MPASGSARLNARARIAELSVPDGLSMRGIDITIDVPAVKLRREMEAAVDASAGGGSGTAPYGRRAA